MSARTGLTRGPRRDIRASVSLNALVARLQENGCQPKEIGNGQWEACCPAHDDRTPSFGFREDDGRILIKCLAGCDYRDVLSRLGMTPKDLMPDEPDDARPKEASVYPYLDETGATLYEVIRFVPKGFKQRRPDGKGGYDWKLGDVRRVLYRLPSILQAVKDGKTIWCTEGEKDADALVTLGHEATTSVGGAGKWKPEYTETLKGARKVIVVADRDAPGRKHAREVADALLGSVGEVGVVEPIAGKDVTDHLVAGHGVAELKLTYAPAKAPERRLRLVPASGVKPKPVRWLWTGRIPAGALTLLAGREGSGKSSVSYDVGAALTRGKLPGVYQGTPKGVMVAATEDSWEHTIAPRLMAAHADMDRIFRIEVASAEGLVDEVVLPTDLDALMEQSAQVDAALLLLDPLLSRLSSTLDTHKDAEVRRALEPLVRASSAAGWATVGIIHVSKAMSSDPLQLIMGSRAFPAVARTVLFVAHHPTEGDARLLDNPKNNLGPRAPALKFAIESTHVTDTSDGAVWSSKVVWQGETSSTVEDALDEASGASTKVGDAAAWLEDYLATQGGSASSRDIKAAGRKEGHDEWTLKRAQRKLGLRVTSRDYPRRTYWALIEDTPYAGTMAHAANQGGLRGLRRDLDEF